MAQDLACTHPGAGRGVRARLFSAAAGTLLLLFVPAVHAIGLGDMEVVSKFNEPLEARIPLRLDADAVDTTGISYGLASAAEFKRAGLRRDYGLQSIEFEHAVMDDGGQYLLLRGRARVREPVFSIVVYLQSLRGGRILRTYVMSLEVEEE